MAESQLGCDESERVAGCLRRQCGAAAQPGIYLYDAVLPAVRVECVLDVAFADDLQMSYHLECCSAQHLIIEIVQRLTRCNHNGFTRVNA